MTVDDVMTLLEDEYVMERACADKTWVLMKKTRNPFKRMRMKKQYWTFMDHSIGVKMAILRINRIRKEKES